MVEPFLICESTWVIEVMTFIDHMNVLLLSKFIICLALVFELGCVAVLCLGLLKSKCAIIPIQIPQNTELSPMKCIPEAVAKNVISAASRFAFIFHRH